MFRVSFGRRSMPDSESGLAGDEGVVRGLHRRGPMGLGFSIFLIVLGAIMRYGLRLRPQAIDLEVTGLILMIAGGLGLVLSLVLALTGHRRPA